jgi:preprotein translocase subunit SecE
MNDDKKKEKPSGEPGVLKNTYNVYKAEFRKIVWPSRETLVKHTFTVIAVSLMFGAYIALNDYIFSAVFQQFVQRVIV